MEIIDYLAQLDESLLLWLNSMHSAYFDTFMHLFSSKLVWIPMYAAILYVIFRNLRLKEALFCLLAVGLTILIADQVGASIIRPMVERLRPSNLANPISSMVHIVDGVRGGRYGFPSCHAANTAGLALFVHLLFRHRGLSWFMLAWSVITCYSRIYLGVHYPGDIIVGILIGALSAWLMHSLMVRLSVKTASVAHRHIHAPIIVGSLTIITFAIIAIF